MPQLRHFRSILMVVGIVLQARPVLSAPSTVDGAEVAEAPTPTPASPTAEELYATAQSQYAAGDLDAALRAMTLCYEATNSANTLFNVAQLHRELSHCEAALEHYERYLAATPDGERAVDARRYADELREQCPPAELARPLAEPLSTRPRVIQPPVVQTQATRAAAIQHAPSSPRSHWNTVGWVAMGTGAVAAAAAVYFAVETRHASRDVEDLDEAAQKSPHPNRATIQDRLDDFKRDRTLGYTFGAVAALAFGTGVCAWVVAMPKDRTDVTSWSLTVSPYAMQADLRVRF